MSFRLLAIDTTTEYGSLALVNESGVLEEVSLYSPEGYGPVLFVEIQQLLARHGLGAGDLDGFAAASGPGTFTGVRVALTAAKGLAYASGRSMVAVSNLRALAWYGTHALRATVLDARRGEIYGAVYDAGLELVQAELVAKLPEWLAGLPPGPAGELECIGNDDSLLGVECRYQVTQAPRALAGAIGCIARDDFARGRAQDPALIDANYVRRADAELFWKEA